MAPNYTTPGELMRQENRRIIDDAKKKGDWEFFKTSIGLNAGALADALGAFNGASGPARGAMGNLGQAPNAPQSQSRGRYTWEGGGASDSPPWRKPTQEEIDRYPYKLRPDTGGENPTARSTTTGTAATQPEKSTWYGGQEMTRTVGPQDVRYGFGAQGSAIVHGGANNMREPGSHFRGGYDPAAARNYQQIGANTYMNDRGLMIQGNQADADYIYRFRHGASTPIFTPAPQRQEQAQPQMPNYQPVGWKSKLAWNKALLDSADKAAQREMLREHYQGMDARAAEQLGFQQEQARQQMELARMGHGLQAGHLANETAKAAWEQEAAAMGLEQQRAMLGARQELMAAYASGNLEAVKNAQQKIQALTAGEGTGKEKSPTYRKGSWTDPITGDEKERWFKLDGATATPVEVQRTPQDQAYDQARQMAMQDPRIAERIRKAKTPQEVQAIYDTLIQANAGKGAKK